MLEVILKSQLALDASAFAFLDSSSLHALSMNVIAIRWTERYVVEIISSDVLLVETYI